MIDIAKKVLLLASVLLLTACATPQKYDYTAFKQSKPSSIVVLPPLNNTPDIHATYGFLSTVSQPLAESGYYVFPVALVDQTFKENGLMNPGEIHEAPLNKIREIFGTDAVLYITVSRYGSSYQVVDTQIIVSADAKLIDARTGQKLWEGTAQASDAEGRNNNSSGGVAGILIAAIVQQVINNISEEGSNQRIARIASNRLLLAQPNGLLHGPRSPLYEK